MAENNRQGTTEQDINEILRIRREKLQTLVDEGKDRFSKSDLTARQIRRRY